MCVYVARAEEREREARTDSTTRARQQACEQDWLARGVRIRWDTDYSARISAKW